jgi:preprotein translocase subunit YajC
MRNLFTLHLRGDAMFTNKFLISASIISFATLNTTLAHAQEAAAEAMPQASTGASMLPLLLILAIMYFLVIRPQHKKLKEHQALVQNLKRGDVVITSGGIRGTITKIEENNRMVQVEIANGVEVSVVRTTISEVEFRKGDGKTPANDVLPAETSKKSKK